MKKNYEPLSVAADFPVRVEKHYHDSYWKIVGRHQHKNTLQLFLLEQGKGTFYCGGKNHLIKSGDLILINCNEYHSFEVASSSAEFTITKIDLELLLFYCSVGTIAEFVKKIRYNQILFNAYAKDEMIHKALLELITADGAADEKKQFRILALTLDILYRLLEDHIQSYFTEKDTLQLGNNWRKFHEIRDYLEKNYEEKITLEQAAEIAGMSKGYFCAKFKQNTGKSFVDYLNLLRMEKAVSILSSSDLPVIDVAMSVGFDDVNYFCRVFRKYMHQSPSEFRKNTAD